MKIRGLAAGFIVTTVLLAFSATAGERKSKLKEPSDQKSLRKADQTLDRVFLMSGNTFGAKLERAVFEPKPMMDNAKKMMKKTPKDLRPRAAALVARIHHIVMKKPTEGLSFITPFLIGKDKSEAWEKALDTNYKEAIKRWKESAKEDNGKPLAKPEKRDVFAPLPPVAEWNLTGENFRCAVEAGYIFLSLNRRQDALSVFKYLGEKYKDNMAAILADEGGGELHCLPGQYEKAVGFFKHAIKTANHIAKYLNDDPFGEAAHAAARIQKKLNNASRLADIEKYGEGYCDYRRCEVLRRTRHLPFEAFLAFAKLKNKYPKTIWESASDSYLIKCMLSLTNPKHVENAKKSIAQAEKEFNRDEKELEKAERSKALKKDKALRELFRDELEKRREGLVKMRAVPLNNDALTEAELSAKKLLGANKFQIYNGEVQVDLATFAFENKLQPEESFKRYNQAWKWLSEVERADTDLAALAIPGKAKKVSRPPAKEFKKDTFGNIKKEDIAIGTVLNRTTAPDWYLNDLRERCALAIGFLHFCKGENKKAILWYEKVVNLDQKAAELQGRKQPNNYSRMKWGAEHGYLYAYPDELKYFKGRMRFAALLGDFYYCTDRFDKAEHHAMRLINGECGKLSLKQMDYAHFLCASAVYRRDRKRSFILYEKVLASRENTLTEDRALQVLGNMTSWVRDVKMIKQGLEYQRELANTKRKNEFVYKARLEYGWRLLKAGKLDEGQKLLHDIPEEAKGYWQAAQYYLNRKLETKKPKKG